MKCDILHVMAVPTSWSFDYRYLRIDEMMHFILKGLENKTINESDVVYVIPASDEYVPELHKGAIINKFRMCINDGETVRIKRGTLRLLLKWALDEFSLGHITRQHSCFITPVYRKV